MRLYENEISITDELVNGANIMTDCERFGMSHGCQPNCPVYRIGKCELQDENEMLFKTNGLE